MPRKRDMLAVVSVDDRVLHRAAKPQRARPTSAPLRTAVLDVTATVRALGSEGVPRSEMLYRLFTRYGVSIPYQYFYKPKCFVVIPRLDLFVWKGTM